MEARVAAIHARNARELVWLLEHPPLYTAGTSAAASDLLEARFPVFQSGRGGQFTYHGPGQRVAYVMLNLKKRSAPAVPDLRAYVQALETWMIETFKEFGIESFTREGRIGVWTHDPKRGEAKIAALGVRVRAGVSYHGIAINVQPDLSHFSGIVPCGIREFGVTSMAELGKNAPLSVLDTALVKNFGKIFSPGFAS